VIDDGASRVRSTRAPGRQGSFTLELVEDLLVGGPEPKALNDRRLDITIALLC
jgi:hypothetical protein